MAEPSAERPLEILLVEDNPGDARLVAEALSEGQPRSRLQTVGDGVQALAFLRRQEAFDEAPRPDLILLDLNLPKKDGREVLAEVKEDPHLRRIPVVILSTSRAEHDLVQTYDLGANCYVVKPMELDRFIEVVQSVEAFWREIATRAPEGPAP